MDNFVHLHNHSVGSLLDGFSTPEEIVDRVYKIEQGSVAITDHGTMAAMLPFYEYAKKKEIKPIIGIEAYLADDKDSRDKDSAIYHIVLLAKNNNGLQNLYKLSDIGWNQGFYRRPRIDLIALSDYSDGIICLSGCMNGVVSQAILHGDRARAEKKTQELVDIFESDFFIEVQPWNEPALNEELLTLAELYYIPAVVTADSHYSYQEDKVAEEISLIIAQNQGFNESYKKVLDSKFKESRKITDDLRRINYLHPDRKLRYDKIDNYLLTRNNLSKKMKDMGIDRSDIYDNTVSIAEVCDVEIEFDVDYFPKYSTTLNSDKYLKDLAVDSLEQKGLDKVPGYTERLLEELDVIQKLNFSNYFLVIWDIIYYAKSKGILVGPGRGSVGGSLLAYVLGITRIDPIKHDLLFWRFLNIDDSGKSARNEPPDIDTDFEDRRRDEVKNYITDKWKHVASISTVSKFSSKNMVRDICRVYAVPQIEVNEVCKKFDNLEEFLTNETTLQFRNKYPEVSLYAKKFEGRWRSNGVHAAGVVIANKRLDTILPLESRSSGLKERRVPVTAYDMDGCQKIGLIKMDILGVAALSVISDTLSLVKQRRGTEIDLDNIPLDDADVLREFTLGHTVGVFQTEAQSYTTLLKKMGVDSFQDLVASNALVRPGPLLTATEKYIARKHGEEEVPKQHDLVQEITKDTYGLFIYQEQLLQSLVNIGGFTWSDADKIRKIIGKKRDPEEFRPYEETWMMNAGKVLGRMQAKKIWNDFLKFAGYAFNKSHACAYSLLSYQTMWLKKHYGLEYIYSLLKNEKELDKITTFILEAKRMNINILTPDVNISDTSFSIDDDGNIRYGLSQIKGVGIGATEEILDKRPFDSYQDFLSSVTRRKCTSRVIDSLSKVGAFDSLPDYDNENDVSEYLYDYLGYPKDFTEYQMGTLAYPIESLEHYSRENISIIKVLVKKLKQKPTYIRVDVEDQTASGTFFMEPSISPEIKEGEVILALVYGSDLIDYVYADEFKIRVESKQDLNRFERFLLGEIFSDETLVYDYDVGTFESHKSLAMPIHIRKFKVRNGPSKGMDMAAVMFSDGKEVKKAILFPNSYSELRNKITIWKPVVVIFGEAKDGTVVINKDGLRTIDEFKMLKGII